MDAAKRALLILGAVVVLLVSATVAVALVVIARLEREKNFAKTSKARENRWKEKTDNTQDQETQQSEVKLTVGEPESKSEVNGTAID